MQASPAAKLLLMAMAASVAKIQVKLTALAHMLLATLLKILSQPDWPTRRKLHWPITSVPKSQSCSPLIRLAVLKKTRTNSTTSHASSLYHLSRTSSNSSTYVAQSTRKQLPTAISVNLTCHGSRSHSAQINYQLGGFSLVLNATIVTISVPRQTWKNPQALSTTWRSQTHLPRTIRRGTG